MKNFILFSLFVFFADPLYSQEQQGSSEIQHNFHFQATTVTQGHWAFNSPYEGQNSLLTHEDAKTSFTSTFFGGLRLSPSTEFYINPELTGGEGLSLTHGLAGFPNGEIYRVEDAQPVWNIARFYIKEVIGFGGGTEKIEDDKNQLATSYDVNRLTAIFGKFALNDFLDNNSLSHDPRTQFLNWTLMDYGAWDYGADTRGYTWGLYLEFNQKNWSLRYARVLEPAIANGMEYDMALSQAYGDNLEGEYRYSINNQPGVVRLLAYENHANMGNYQTTINTPSYNMDIARSRSYSTKYGFGFSLEQKLNADLGIFSRLSWNDGKTETWAFTEIDTSASVGAVYKDHIGLAAIINYLSNDHRQYLANGGYGFMIGDGKLNYSPEKILETYYLYRFTKEAAATADYQLVIDPGYNDDRGPASIFALRLHYEM